MLLSQHVVIRVNVDLTVLEPGPQVPVPLGATVYEVLRLDGRLTATDFRDRMSQLNQAIEDPKG